MEDSFNLIGVVLTRKVKKELGDKNTVKYSPTLQKFPSFGRVYAAHGGVFIILSVLWGWGVDKKTPDTYDWIGAVICLIGVSIMLW